MAVASALSNRSTSFWMGSDAMTRRSGAFSRKLVEMGPEGVAQVRLRSAGWSDHLSCNSRFNCLKLGIAAARAGTRLGANPRIVAEIEICGLRETPRPAHYHRHENRHLEHQRRQGPHRRRRHLAQGDEARRSPASRRSSAPTRPSRPGPSRRSATTSPCMARRASTASPSSPSAGSTRWRCAGCPATTATRMRATSRRWCRARGGIVRVACLYLPNGNPIGTDKFAYKLALDAAPGGAHARAAARWRSRSCWWATSM